MKNKTAAGRKNNNANGGQFFTPRQAIKAIWRNGL